MDLLLTRYNNVDMILKLSWSTGLKLVNKAYQEQEKDRLYSVWLAKYQYMTEKTFVSFEDFYASFTEYQQKALIPKRSTQEILNEAKEIRKSLGKGW